MTENSSPVDHIAFAELKVQLTEKLLGNEDTVAFFGLDEEKVRNWMENLVFRDKNEIRFSPGYMSAGYGHNQSTQPAIAMTDISSSVNNYLHEARHGLHNLVCQALFEGNDEEIIENLKAFKENVLGDNDFVGQINRPGSSPLQEKMLKSARAICSKENPSPQEVGNSAWMLGALIYQHAYYVDPGMCEAAASYNDRGVTLFISQYNRWFAKLLLPGEQYLEGYSNPEWQKLFKQADRNHKAILIKKTDYRREDYFR